MQLVSVIVPNFNHAQFLPKRIESIINQTYSNIEVIILDDCSTDNSRDIIDNYAKRDDRIKLVYNSSNSGNTFLQWKKGIDLAIGEYLWIAESDDYSDIHFLENLINVMNKNRGVNLVYCQSNFVNVHNEIVGNHIDNLQSLNPTLWLNDFLMDGNQVLSNYMLIINVIPNAGAVLFKKELLEKVYWNKLLKFKLGGDRFFWINVIKDSLVFFVADSFNYFRIDGNTQRKRYINTTTYLNEVSVNVNTICSQVRVSYKNKFCAVKQWLQYLRIARRMRQESFYKFYFSSFLSFIRLVTIFFK